MPKPWGLGFRVSGLGFGVSGFGFGYGKAILMSVKRFSCKPSANLREVKVFGVEGARNNYYRGLNNYQYYFLGVPYYNYSIIYPKTLF